MAATPLSLLSRLAGLISRGVRNEPPPAPETTAQLLQKLTADFNTKVDALVNGMESGTVTIGQFVGAMPSLIRQQQLAASIIGEGGTHLATPDTLALANQAVAQQMTYFDKWKAQLLTQAAKGELPSMAYIANRAKMYGKAAGETVQRAVAQAHGLPELPFYPGSKTICHGFCRCLWDIKTLDVVNGNYDCFYLTDELAEHCPVCVARARVANPLRVRHGVIVDAERYQEAGLYA